MTKGTLCRMSNISSSVGFMTVFSRVNSISAVFDRLLINLVAILCKKAIESDKLLGALTNP